MMKEVLIADYKSPLGWIRIQGNQEGICRLDFIDDENGFIDQGVNPQLKEWVAQIDQYFQRRRTSFELPLVPNGSDFDQQVWAALQKIPFGQAVSYGDIARQIGRPTAARAVGGANHRNPIAIVIPCHRVIGSQGKLTGYGSGLWRKKWLLEHEGINLV
ncbi:methylated-DNA--[protein]-cysteine S-methyltransferase [Syntrophomonas erecta]